MYPIGPFAQAEAHYRQTEWLLDQVQQQARQRRIRRQRRRASQDPVVNSLQQTSTPSPRPDAVGFVASSLTPQQRGTTRKLTGSVRRLARRHLGGQHP
jgi:hypothetical protein